MILNPDLKKDIVQRLKESARRVIDRVVAEGAQLGDSETVLYPSQFAKEQGISELGRMVKTEAQFQFHAGPKALPEQNSIKYDYKFDNSGLKWLTSGKTFLDIRPIEGDMRAPVGQLLESTRALFQHVVKDEVVVQDPSGTTMIVAEEKADRIRVVAFDSNDARWRDSNKAIEDKNYEGPHPVFTGLGVPKGRYKKWYALLPNPYVERSFGIAHLDESPGMFSLSVARQGQEYRWTFVGGELKGWGPVYIYGPSHVSRIGIDQSYFLVSIFQIDFPDSHENFFNSSSQYLPAVTLDEMEEEVERTTRQGSVIKTRLKIYHRGGNIFDVKEFHSGKYRYEGTYLSRRSRWERWTKLPWQSYTTEGIPISFFTMRYQKGLTKTDRSITKMVIRVEKGHAPNNVSVVEKEGSITHIQTTVSPGGTLLVPERWDGILYGTQREYEVSRWLDVSSLKKPFLKPNIATYLSEIKSEMEVVGTEIRGRPKKENSQFLNTDFQMEIGMPHGGVDAHEMASHGYVKFKVSWYLPWETRGVIEAPGYAGKGVDLNGKTYAEFFSSVMYSSDKLYYVGQQGQKIAIVLDQMGLPSVFEEEGLLKVLRISQRVTFDPGLRIF